MVTVELVTTTNYILSIFTIVGIIVSVALLVDFLKTRLLSAYVEAYGMMVALAVAVIATCITLIYSEVFGVLPCGLCWFERIMLYPQILIVSIALYIKDTSAPLYGIALSALGLFISLYHHYIQMGGSQFITCPTSGGDCAKRIVFEFGFVTFPLMSAVLCAFMIVLYLYILKVRRP